MSVVDLTRRRLLAATMAAVAVAAATAWGTRASSRSARVYASGTTYPRVLALGDSLTFGSGASLPNNAYAYSVVTGLRARGAGEAMFYLLHGNPGITTADAITCLQQMQSSEAADLVLVELGTNDEGQAVAPATFQAQYVSLLGMLRTQSPTGVIVGLSCWRDPTAASQYNAIIADALANHVSQPTHYVDIGSLYSNPAYHATSGDTFHPNDAGHAAICAAILAVV